MTVGDRIKRRRIALGMSQEELARKVGYKTKSSISKMEKGFRDASQSKLLELATALECSVEYLLLGTEKSPHDGGQKEEVYRIVNGLSGEQLQKFLELAKMFRDAEHSRLGK